MTSSVDRSDESIEWHVFGPESAVLRTFLGGFFVWAFGSALAYVARSGLDALGALGSLPVVIGAFAATAFLLGWLVLRETPDGMGEPLRSLSTPRAGEGWQYVVVGALAVAPTQLALYERFGFDLLVWNLLFSGAYTTALLASIPVVALFSGDGRYDPETGFVAYNGGRIDLDRVRRLRPIRLGPVVYLRAQLDSEADRDSASVLLPRRVYRAVAEDERL
jgi:hypothetical protein